MDPDNLEDVIGQAADELGAATEAAPVEAPAPVVESAPAEPAETAAPAGETAEQKAARERDNKGRFAPKAKDAKAAEKAVAATAEAKPADLAKEAAPSEAAKQADVNNKAPSSWKPAAREKWASLPPEVQQEAVRLDREVRQTLEQTAAARKFHETFERTLTPYMPLLRAGGAEPVQRIAEMAQTFHTLQSGTQEQKARLIFDAIQSNRIPLDAINAYFENPSAQPTQQAAAQPTAEEVEQRVMQRFYSQQATQQWQAFAAQNEFAMDVKDDMALLLRAAAEQQRPMTYADAYKRAVAMNDSVQQALAQRKEAEAANQRTQTATQARAATVSVRNSPAGVAPQRKLESIEDYVEAAAEELRARR